MSNHDDWREQRCDFSRMSFVQKESLEKQAFKKAHMERSRMFWRGIAKIKAIMGNREEEK